MLTTIDEPGIGAPKALRALAALALAAAACVAAWTGGRLFWAALALRHPATLPRTAPAIPASSSDGVATVDLASLHLFGQAGMRGPEAAAPAPETRLALALLGTAAAEDPADGLAIVADEGGRQGFYRAGDRLPGGAELREIHVDRILIARAGRLETLRLKRDERSAGAAGTPGRSPASPAVMPARPDRTASNAATDWQALRRESRLDPAALQRLGSQIRAMPHMENGEAIGVRLVASRDATMIHRLGLRSSDVITSVNGIPLNDPSRQFELLRALESQSRFQVRLRRGGRDMTLSIDASKLQEVLP